MCCFTQSPEKLVTCWIKKVTGEQILLLFIIVQIRIMAKKKKCTTRLLRAFLCQYFSSIATHSSYKSTSERHNCSSCTEHLRHVRWMISVITSMPLLEHTSCAHLPANFSLKKGTRSLIYFISSQSSKIQCTTFNELWLFTSNALLFTVHFKTA